MIPCQQLSERMPSVALGHSRWSAAEEAHLASCADCQGEWNLIQVAGRLGASSPSLVDPEVISANVRRRLEDARAGRRAVRRWTLVGLGVAAAIAVALWTGRPATRRPIAALPSAPPASPAPVRPPDSVAKPPTPVPTAGPVAHAELPRLDLPVPGIDELSDSDLDDLLRAMNEPLAGNSMSPDDGVGLGDPDDRELAGALTVEEG
jgi:hypothetical protein